MAQLEKGVPKGDSLHTAGVLLGQKRTQPQHGILARLDPQDLP